MNDDQKQKFADLMPENAALVVLTTGRTVLLEPTKTPDANLLTAGLRVHRIAALGPKCPADLVEELKCRAAVSRRRHG